MCNFLFLYCPVEGDLEDDDDIVARKMFKQFQLKSVKENSSSVTILNEKCLYSLWMETLTNFGGIPEDKGPNGSKFTVVHTVNDVPCIALENSLSKLKRTNSTRICTSLTHILRNCSLKYTNTRNRLVRSQSKATITNSKLRWQSQSNLLKELLLR